MNKKFRRSEIFFNNILPSCFLQASRRKARRDLLLSTLWPYELIERRAIMPIINAFGGQRLIGFVNKKPLVAKFKLDIDSFEVGFNQTILDKEYAGQFDKNLLGSSLEILEKRYTAPLGKPYSTLGAKGTLTTVSTLPWIASLIDAAEVETGSGNKKISKELFEKIAQAIYASNAFHRPDLESGLIKYLDVSKQFNLQPSSQYKYTEMGINRLFSQFSKSMSVFSQITTIPHSYLLFEKSAKIA